jgi:hypothetical protein
MILLDTNVLSEFMEPAPAQNVARWVAARPAASLYTTGITQAGILHSINVQIAAIARSTGAALATRNVADFDDCGLDVIDPWSRP